MFNLLDKTDSQIQADVMNELLWDPSVTADQVSASVKNGIVTLRGNIPHYSEKLSASQAAQRVGGVRAVADEIEVKLLGSYERSDEDIASAALNALKWGYSVPKGIKVKVDHGWVTLGGVADWDYQRNAAKDAVSQLMGVRGVSNDISLHPKIQPSDITTRIKNALKRSAENEGRDIAVKVEGDEVSLSGEVHSSSEMEDARFAAWMAPGVMRVTNNLRITQ